MDNLISNQTAFSKCLSFLPFEIFKSLSLDSGVKKLTTANLMKICVTMQLGNWKSYEEAEERIRAMEGTEELYGLTSISASQLILVWAPFLVSVIYFGIRFIGSFFMKK